MTETHRLIALMHDGTTVVRDYTPKQPGPDHWFEHLDNRKTVQLADMVVMVELRTLRTEVLKNRWGDTGEVVRRSR